MKPITVPPSVTCVLAVNQKAAEENANRMCFGGSIMVPPWDAWLHGLKAHLKHLVSHPKALVYPSNLDSVLMTVRVPIYSAVPKEGGKLDLRACFGKFPHDWAPRDLRESTCAWLEAQGGVTLHLTPNEEPKEEPNVD